MSPTIVATGFQVLQMSPTIVAPGSQILQMSPIEALDLRSCSGRSGSGSVLAGPHNTAAGEEAPEPWLPYSPTYRAWEGRVGRLKAVWGLSPPEDPFARPDLIRGGVAAPVLPITPTTPHCSSLLLTASGCTAPHFSNFSHFPPSLIFALL